MPDPVERPAIVQPAQFADRLTQLLAEAQAFGRKTLESKVATGRKLNEAFEEWQSRNATAKLKTSWAKTVRRIGMSEDTAKRLRTAAASDDTRKLRAGLLKSQVPELDAIYDDGLDPSLDPDKKPCQLCRKSGKAFGPKCTACLAFNRQPPAPKDDKPITDMDGNPVPAPLVNDFAEGKLICEFGDFLLRGMKYLTGLLEKPGCSAINHKEVEKRMRTLKSFAQKYRPGLPCEHCGGSKCDKCQGHGWRTVMEVADERAAIANKKKQENYKKWKAGQQRSNGPLPE